MGLVIDTSALVAAERASATWESALSTLGNEPAALPAIVCAELLTGVRFARSTARAASRRAKIDALLAKVPVVDFGLPIAERPPPSISASEWSSVLWTKPTSARYLGSGSNA